MINLFNIPTYQINTASFSNLLHDKVVTEFEEAFAKYVGAKYAVSFNSATSAIFLLYKIIGSNQVVNLPTMIPPVVPNAIINSGNLVQFYDNPWWVGNSYIMQDDNNYLIIDSAQKVNKNQYNEWICKNHDTPNLIIYSFYPTKPVGGCDGGMIVSDNKQIIDQLRVVSMNGMSQGPNSWERIQTMVGHKMYMNSIQAFIAMQNLYKLEMKKTALAKIREIYNFHFFSDNGSDHLYRINVHNQERFIELAGKAGITCGIHYQPAHYNPIYGQQNKQLPKSKMTALKTVSIPFHENLTEKEIDIVINFVKTNR